MRLSLLTSALVLASLFSSARAADLGDPGLSSGSDVAGLPSWAAPATPEVPSGTNDLGPVLPPAPPVGVPVDGGLVFLAAAGVGLAAQRFRRIRRRGGAAAVALLMLMSASGVQAQTTVTVTGQLTGGRGWRMLGMPVAGRTVADLASQNLVQGVTGQYPNAGDNLYLSYNGNNSDNSGDIRNGFVPATSTTEGITPGRGFIWYFYDQNLGPAAGGTSQSYELPHTISVTGTEASNNWSLLFPSRLLGSADGFYLIANPYSRPFDLSGVGAGAVGLGSLQNVFQVWNPNSGQTTTQGNGTPGSYVTVNRLLDILSNDIGDDLAPWQGAFAEIDAVLGTNLLTTFSFDSGAILSGTRTIYGRPATGTSAEASEIGVVQFHLGGTTESGQAVYDGAASVAFTDVSDAGWDSYDATKLASLESTAWIAPVGAGRTGDPVEKAQEALPLGLEAEATVPLHLTTAERGSFTLRWSGLDQIPASWALTLTDTQTGATVDLRTEAEYAFTSDAVEGGARFALVIRPERSTADEVAPLAGGFSLSAVGPNPTVGAAHATLRVETAQTVTATLYDALGRQVGRLFDGPVSAGADVAVRVDGAGLVPGVYVLRVDGETFSASRRLTIYR